MAERCCAVWPTGKRCDGLAVVDQPSWAGCVWYQHAPPGPRQQPAIHATIRKAITRPDRNRVAAPPAWLDEDLAAELECPATWVRSLRRTGDCVGTGWTRRGLWSQP
jgi:hypothetical protein